MSATGLDEQDYKQEEGKLTVPMHIEVTAIRLFCRRSSDRAVTTWRAPVQPSGCPMALVTVSLQSLFV